VSRRRAVLCVHRARGGARVASRYPAREGGDKRQATESRAHTLAPARTDIVCARQEFREASAGKTAERKYHVSDCAQEDQRMQAFEDRLFDLSVHAASETSSVPFYADPRADPTRRHATHR